jgi:hypothetical protein
VNNVAGGPTAEIGIDLINGDGKRGVIRSTGSRNGVIEDWTTSPPYTGTYTVERDCTGSFFSGDGMKDFNIIVLDGGKRFSAVSVQTDAIVTAEGTRLEED